MTLIENLSAVSDGRQSRSDRDGGGMSRRTLLKTGAAGTALVLGAQMLPGGNLIGRAFGAEGAVGLEGGRADRLGELGLEVRRDHELRRVGAVLGVEVVEGVGRADLADDRGFGRIVAEHGKHRQRAHRRRPVRAAAVRRNGSFGARHERRNGNARGRR